MDYAELNKLEENVRKAIAIIEKLHSENLRLKRETEELVNKLNRSELTIQQLKNHYQSSRNEEDQYSYSKEKEEKIKMKVKRMLEKIESFQK